MNIRRFIWAAVLSAAVTACAPVSRHGMIIDRQSGLQFGSVVSDNFVTDASFFRNAKIKIRIRNTSGDLDFGVKRFRRDIASSLQAAGYEITTKGDFGLLFDVNVRYAGQATENLMTQYAILGGAGAGLGVGKGNRGTAGAVISGATIGAILGSYAREETFTVITYVTLGIVGEGKKGTGKSISFGASKRRKTEDTAKRGFRKTRTAKISVYAGGRNISSKDIALQVKQRLARILGDMI